MLRHLLLLGLLAIALPVLGQQQESPHVCGTEQGRSPWLKDYQLKPHQFRKGGDTTIYVAMAIHIVGTDNGGGYYSEATLLDAFCLLNEYFLPSGIQFVISGDILYHDNTTYYDHATVLEGYEMMVEYNVPNALNTYFVGNPAGNCGYNLPYAGIANSNSCSGPNDVTWSHEVGHALSLPHPFLGWEGGVSWDGSVDHNFSDPAPERVTYDYTFFQDTLIMDTLIIDTAYVERVDGSNCHFAADGFCDTPPDYLAVRWSCNGQGVSPTTQNDPTGEAFQSQGSFIMNYSNDACQTRFSLEQQQAMRAFLFDQREHWTLVFTGNPPAPVSEAPILIAPIGGEIQSVFEGELSWEPAPEATDYVVQVSRLSSFPPALTSTYLTQDPSLVTDELDDGRTYYWRVRGFNEVNTCSDYSTVESFIVEHPTSTNELEQIGSWMISPQPLTRRNNIQIRLASTSTWKANAEVVNSLGQVVWQQQLFFNNGTQVHTLPNTDQLVPGMYVLRLSADGQQSTLPLIVQ
ncbi:MAG: zinc-dependent metalloprotease [Bacteroidota bacterium]